MAELNAAAPRITDHLCEAVPRLTSPPSAAHLDALGDRLPPRARPGPRPRLLHPNRVRVLRHRPGGPAAGPRRRRSLRRAGRAARAAGRRPASASGSVSTGSCWPARTSKPRRARRTAAATRPHWPSSSGPIRRTPRPASGSPPTCAPRASRPGPTWAGRKLGPPARVGRPGSGPFRGDHRRRAGRRERPAQGPRGRLAAARRARRPGPQAGQRRSLAPPRIERQLTLGSGGRRQTATIRRP